MTIQENEIKNVIEAALFAFGKPLTLDAIANLFQDDDEVSKEVIRKAIESLEVDCQARGVELKKVASGYRFQAKQDYAKWLQPLWEEKPPRYSRALLETMVLIAYKQPITRGEIEDVRGVSVSSHIVKTLQERDWIRVVGHRDVPGKPALFATTKGFLDYFNLDSLEELPSLAQIRDLDKINEELEFPDGVPETPDLDVDPPKDSLEVEDFSETADSAEVEGVSEIEDFLETEDAADSAGEEDASEIENSLQVEDVSETADSAEVEDVSEVEDSLKAEDVSETADSAEVEDVSEVEDSLETEDVSETTDSAEVEDVSEIEDSLQVEDVLETTGSVEVEDVPETADSVDAEATSESEVAEQTDSIEITVIEEFFEQEEDSAEPPLLEVVSFSGQDIQEANTDMDVNAKLTDEQVIDSNDKVDEVEQDVTEPVNSAD